MEGGAAIINCYSEDRIVWKHNDNNISSNYHHLLFKNNLIVLDVSPATEGEYICYKVEGQGTVIVGSSRLELSSKNIHSSF